METKPTKAEIEAVFTRLRSIPANKVCFDCNAKNPTWSSVTYGVIICLDCSAVHRNLGVHLTFVRSTQLDTNWTWVQLRQMQLGGNNNAQQFFQQHNCVTTDATKKYNSRAAQLYRDKLHHLALNAVKNNSELHINAYVEEKVEEKEVDFFSEHEKFATASENTGISQEIKESKVVAKQEPIQNDQKLDGPKVDFSTAADAGEVRKSTIGIRKVQPKKSGLGAKKGGLGATKVKTNFADIEREAELAEESRLRAQEEVVKQAAITVQEKIEQQAAMRLAYQDLSAQQTKKEEMMKKTDPRKAEQMERLGMGVNNRTGVSHSMLTEMKTIEQENLQSTPSSLGSLGKLRLDDNGFDSYNYTFSMNRNASGGFSSSKDYFADMKDFNSSSNSSNQQDLWVIVDDPPSSKPTKYDYDKPVERERERDRTPKKTYDDVGTGDAAQKKFGNAKGISSSQYFDDGVKDYETQANLNRFQGSSSISSSDFFGTGGQSNHPNNSFQAPDLEDVRESVRQGVTKVAGKLSSLANGVMSSLQDKYGY
ncbi:ADP-ribosylation factor GTPase-activating protein 3 isoform X2 [Atheta coriaria]|uniref:ADP-ribosylation factor GTPase-activating protein 3 isoform X2 n=1 Tax=Dalotia coriaria TaxID=877792 RepID=UPI0031F3B17F